MKDPSLCRSSVTVYHSIVQHTLQSATTYTTFTSRPFPLGSHEPLFLQLEFILPVPPGVTVHHKLLFWTATTLHSVHPWTLFSWRLSPLSVTFPSSCSHKDHTTPLVFPWSLRPCLTRDPFSSPSLFRPPYPRPSRFWKIRRNVCKRKWDSFFPSVVFEGSSLYCTMLSTKFPNKTTETTLVWNVFRFHFRSSRDIIRSHSSTTVSFFTTLFTLH